MKLSVFLATLAVTATIRAAPYDGDIVHLWCDASPDTQL